MKNKDKRLPAVFRSLGRLAQCRDDELPSYRINFLHPSEVADEHLAACRDLLVEVSRAIVEDDAARWQAIRRAHLILFPAERAGAPDPAPTPAAARPEGVSDAPSPWVAHVRPIAHPAPAPIAAPTPPPAVVLGAPPAVSAMPSPFAGSGAPRGGAPPTFAAKVHALASTSPILHLSPRGPALPFVDREGAQPPIAGAPGKRAPHPGGAGGDGLEPVASLGKTEDVDESKASAPALPFGAGAPLLTIEQYASLCIEIEARPADRAAALGRYGVAGEAAHQELKQAWARRSAADPAVARRLSELLESFRGWIGSRRR